MRKPKPKDDLWWGDAEERALAAFHAKDPKPDVVQVETDVSGDVIMEEKGPKRPGPDLTPTIDKVPKTAGMDSVAGNTNLLALAATSAAATGNGQETGVSPYPRVQRNLFTETLTVELPWTGWFSMLKLDKTSPVVFKLRLNSPYNFLVDNTIAKQTLGTGYVKGLSNMMMRTGQASTAAAITQDVCFPHTVPGAVGKTATETSSGAISASVIRPANLAWMDKQYESYHVISNAWNIEILSGTTSTSSDDLAIFTEYDAYTGSSTGNIIPTTRPLRDYMRWRNVSEHRVGTYGKGSNDDGSKRSFSGLWTPTSIHRNTRNEEDIKTWYSTGAEPSPTWVEQLVLLAFIKDDSFLSTTAAVKFRVNCKWTVQFKDLRQFYRYMEDDAGSASSTNLVLPDDLRQLPYTVETVP